jgi:pyruvate dehydrogenase E1 component beta subunit
MLHKCLNAAEMLAEEGIHIEVIDLRTISPMDTETILASVRKTHRVVIAEEDCRTGGVGAEVVARISEEAFYDLDAPILRVAAEDTPVPTSKTLEDLYLPQVDDIIQAVTKVCS